jgi:hypothetical protein
MTQVSTPPHEFVCPPCWYYQLQEIKKYDFRVDPNGITSIPNFIQNPSSGSRVESCGQTDRQTDRHDHPFCVNFINIVQRTQKMIIIIWKASCQKGLSTKWLLNRRLDSYACLFWQICIISVLMPKCNCYINITPFWYDIHSTVLCC